MSTFNELVDRAVFLSAEHQWHFAEVIAESKNWNVDFQRPVLRFETPDPLELRPHFIGSLSERDASWHWAWDNINGFPESVIAVAEQLGRRAAEVDVDELTRPEVSVAAGSDLPFRLMLAAKALTGIYAHYPADAGGGTQAWILVQSDRLALPEPSIQRIAMLVAQSLRATEVSDHRAALGSYVRLRGLATRSLPGGGLRLLASDGAAEVTFDELNRITEFAQSPLNGADRREIEAATPIPVPEVRVEVAPLPEPTVVPAPTQARPSPPTATAPAASAPAAPAADLPEASSAEASADPASAPSADAPEADGPTPAPRQDEDRPLGEQSDQQDGEDKPRKGLFSRLFGR